ncbi:MAG: DnaJ family domain-containing protein [Chromatiales bacterium]
MLLFDAIAEARIAEAIGRGELDNLPGVGKPLDLDDDCLVAEELRIAYRVLKNAGCLPPEVETRREIHHLRQLLAVVDDAERPGVARRLQLLLWRLSAARGEETDLRAQEAYFQCINERLAAERPG